MKQKIPPLKEKAPLFLKKSPIGLENLGSTCYINACIQILFATDELNRILEKDFNQLPPSNDQPDYVLTREWLELWKEMSNVPEATLISPKRFLHFLQKAAVSKNRPEFSSNEQNDFAEFLYFLIDSFHNCLVKKVKLNIRGRSKSRQDQIAQTCYDYLKQLYCREFSKIFQDFFGLTVSEILYAHQPTPVLSTTPEHFFILDLEIPTQTLSLQPVTLYHCIDRYVGGELLTGNNAWYNEKTGNKETVIKRLSFWHFPPILIICLKRFHHGLNCSFKNNTCVQFPLTGLDLSSYVCGYDAQKYKYNLYATCNHYGTNSYGHYTANIWDGTQWLCHNDENVFPIESMDEFISSAYCLFYRLVS